MPDKRESAQQTQKQGQKSPDVITVHFDTIKTSTRETSRDPEWINSEKVPESMTLWLSSTLLYNFLKTAERCNGRRKRYHYRHRI